MAGHSYLKSMIGKEFKVNRGGHDAVWGKLIDVKSDFLVLDTGEGNGICYFNLKHIKSFNEVIGGQNGQNNGQNGNSKVSYSSNPDYVHATKFTEVLEKLRPNVVTINRGGPEKIEGVLTDANEDYMIVVVNKDIIRIPTYHVKSISLYTGNNDKNDGNVNNKNEKSSKQKSGKNNDKSGKENRSSRDRSERDRSGRNEERRGRARNSGTERTREGTGSRKLARTRTGAKSKAKVRASVRVK